MASAPTDPYAEFEEEFNRLLVAVDKLRDFKGAVWDEKAQAQNDAAWDLYHDLPNDLFWEWLYREHDAGNVPNDLLEFTNQFLRPVDSGMDEAAFESAAKSSGAAAKSSEGAAQKEQSDEPEGNTPEEIAEQRIQECLATSDTTLDLSGLGLTRVPEAIGELKHITELHLENNRLKELPELIGKLTNLRGLFVSRNRLETLPTTIGNLTELTVLIARSNQFESLPNTIIILRNLEVLRFDGNKLETLPKALADMPKLGRIFVSETNISRESLLNNGWPEKALNRVIFDEEPESNIEGETSATTDQPDKKLPPPLRTHSDTATDEDQLGRAPAAEALAARLNLIWRRHARNKHTDPLVMHLNAPWGSGKSSYFLLLRKFLKNPAMPGSDEAGGAAPRPESWAVVQMNAWQHQHVGAPWWSLFQIIFDQLKGQTNTPSTEYNMTLRETWRRFHGRRLPFFVSVGVTVLGLSVLLVGGPGGDVLDLLLGKAVSGSVGAGAFTQLFLGIPVAAAGIFKSVNYFRDTLMPGDAATAERWTSIQKDPRNRLKAHFQGLIDDLDKPLLVFIDDLDRCQPKYVVELLEHVMTIFRHSKVFFLVAADGQWITRCFELEYKEFRDYHSDPGRSLGHHFLEKVFQFSIPLPQPSSELRDAFWRLLTQPALQEAGSATAALTPATSDQGDGPAGETPSISDRDAAQREHQEKIEAFNRGSSRATNAFAKEDTEKTVQSFLGPFSEHVENNPRAMKRLVNAYIVQAIAETARHGRELKEDEQVRLARWVILQHRYPILIDYFRSNPHKIKPVVEHKSGAVATKFKDDNRVQAILEQENKITHILTSPRAEYPTAIVLEPGHIADYLAVEI